MSVIALTVASQASAGHPPIKLIDYVVKEGDTCASISKTYWGDRERYDIIHEFNPQLGPKLPHSLEPGWVLKIPPEMPPDAWVTHVVHKVEHRAAKVDTWTPSKPGAGVAVGYRVNTHERSGAELTFKDDTAVELQANTLLVVYGRSAGTSRKKPRNQAKLERGALRSRLAELRGEDEAPVEIKTASAVASFDGSAAIMSVDPGDLTCISAHDGAPVEVTSAGGGRPIAVKAAMGTRVARGGRPSKPKPLPRAPRWAKLGKILAYGATAEQAVVRASWKPHGSAVRYLVRVEQASGALVASPTLPTTQTTARITGLPAGTYKVSVSAQDAEGYVSKPATALTAQVAEVVNGLSVPVGARIGGCAPAVDPNAPEARLNEAGEVALVCGGEPRTVVVEEAE